MLKRVYILVMMLLVELLPLIDVQADVKEAAGIPYEGNDNGYVTTRSLNGEEEVGNIQFVTTERVDLLKNVGHSCSDVPLLFDKCRPALCQSKTQFGQIYHKIVGFDTEGNCSYLERSPMLGGMTCAFPAAELLRINSVLGDYYAALERGNTVDAERSQAVQKIYADYCKVALDNEVRSIVDIDASRKAEQDAKTGSPQTTSVNNISTANPSSMVPNVAAVSAPVAPSQKIVIPEPTNTVAPVTPISPAPIASMPSGGQSTAALNAGSQQPLSTATAVSANDQSAIATPEPGSGSIASGANSVLVPQGSGVKSVVFRDAELQAVLNAVEIYESKTKASRKSEDSLQNLSNIYLNSILYLGNEKWAVWINDTRIKGDKPSMSLNILGVEADRVFLRWIVNNLDNIVPGWRANTKQLENGRYQVHNQPIEISKLAENVNAITFVLRINQTFVPQQMRVAEGRMLEGAS